MWISSILLWCRLCFKWFILKYNRSYHYNELYEDQHKDLKNQLSPSVILIGQQQQIHDSNIKETHNDDDEGYFDTTDTIHQYGITINTKDSNDHEKDLSLYPIKIENNNNDHHDILSTASSNHTFENKNYSSQLLSFDSLRIHKTNDIFDCLISALKGNEMDRNYLQKQQKFIGINGIKLIFDKLDLLELRTLCLAIHKNCNITSLELGCNDIGDEGSIILTECLHHCNHLNHLSLWGNNITDQGVLSLKDLIGSCPLESLILSNNAIEDNGLHAMSFSIANSLTLRHLDLSVNASITDIGIFQFIETLKNPNHNNSHLETLDLSHGGLGNATCHYLGSWLSQSCHLISLNLSYNIIDDLGIEVLAASLNFNDTLRELNMSGNLFSRKGMKLLLEQMQRCPGRIILMEEMISSQF